MTADLPPLLGKVPLRVISPDSLYCYSLCDVYSMDLNIKCSKNFIKLWLFWAEKAHEHSVEEHFAFSQDDVDQLLRRLFERAQEVLTEKLTFRRNLLREQQRLADRVEESIRLMAGYDHPSLWERLEDSDASR